MIHPQLQHTLQHPAVTGELPLWAHVRERVESSAGVVRERWQGQPVAAIVLGTGLGALAREIAVEEGATMVRLGTILFGSRPA